MKIECRIISLVLFTAVAFAQVCYSAGSTLSSMRDTCRLLLVFANSAKDPAFVHQMEELRAHVSEIKERDIVVIPILSGQPDRSDVVHDLPHDLALAALTESEMIELTRRFHSPSDSFQVVLVGKDGGSKLSANAPVSVGQLSRLIDSMPMRQQEIRERSK